MQHIFDVDIAVKYGVNAAIILKNIGYWVKENEANERFVRNGYVWTVNSVKGFEKLYPYMSSDQIAYALKKLVSEGLIIKGCFNEKATDRTTWYTLTDKGRALLDGSSDFGKSGYCISENGTIPFRKNDPLHFGIVGNDVVSTINYSTTKLINSNYKELIEDIVAYFNEKAKAKYKATSESTRRLIKARLNEGFTLEDFKTVIDKKVDEWKNDPKMRAFIRPETLFGTKFESYLNQQTPKKKGEVSFHGGSFDTDDFFQAAVNRTYENFERRDENEKV